MQQSFYSIFWFVAESLDSLQNWYNRASFCIAPGRFGEFSKDHYHAVTQWLLDPANGKWILIFDNANPELNFGDILPENVPWGKMMFTSRSQDIKVGTKWLSNDLVSIPMPLLSTDEAFRLFMLRCTNLELTQAQKSEVSWLSSSLRHNPLAVTLAGVHFQRFQNTSDLILADHGSSENIDNLIQRLGSLLIEDARMSQRMLIKFFVFLGRRTVSLDIVKLCQRSRRRLRDIQTATEFLTTSNTESAINHWVSIGLLQRQTSPSGPVLGIPSFVERAIEQEMMSDPEQIENILTLGLRLVALARNDTSSTSSESIAECMEKTAASFRNLCLAARDMSIILPDDSGKYLQLAALHFLGKTIQEGRIFFKRLFWRQWLSSFQYPPPSYTTGEKNPLIPVPVFRRPTWLETQMQDNDNFEDLDPKVVVHNELVAKLWNEIKLAVVISGVGRAWHGIREHVFDFANHTFHSDYSEHQKASFIDFIDKGGAEGVQAVIVRVTEAGEFHQEATSRIDSDTADDIVQMICGVSHSLISSLSKEAVHQAISTACEGIMYEIFTEASSAMAEALLPIQELVNTTLQGLLEVPSEGESARKVVSFIVSTTGEQHLRQRCLTMVEGFCEYLETAKIWIVAKVCLHLAYAALDEIESTREVDWQRICTIIELVREGIMPVERIPGRMAEVAGRRMLYWAEEACKCRTAWGAQPGAPVYNFRNEEQWEETRILMGAESGSWILS